MNNRLKLYDSTIRAYISKKDKAKFRKIAFKHKKTVSDLMRDLIYLMIKLDEANKLDLNRELNETDIDNLISSLGGIINN